MAAIDVASYPRSAMTTRAAATISATRLSAGRRDTDFNCDLPAIGFELSHHQAHAANHPNDGFSSHLEFVEHRCGRHAQSMRRASADALDMRSGPVQIGNSEHHGIEPFAEGVEMFLERRHVTGRANELDAAVPRDP